MKKFIFLWMLLTSLAVLLSANPVPVAIDCSQVVVSRSEPLKCGICLNYLIDSDEYDTTRKIKIRDALKNLNVKAIRWNEGEIGDKMIWSVPPYNAPDVHVTHQRTPGTVHYNWRVDDNGKMKNPPMELSECISIARDLKQELYIIVGIDAVWVEDPAVRGKDTSGQLDEEGVVIKRMTDFSWAAEGKSAREMIVDAAEALARYLKSNASDLKVFLEIGNENYLGDANWKPECYATICNELSRKIKAVDPQLKVGVQLANQYKWTSVSADGKGWNETLRETVEFERVDHLVVHQYGFKDTLNLDSAIVVLETLPEADQKRLDITITESGSWHLPGSKERWSANNLRTSLYQFRWLGMLQQNGKGKLRTPLFWTSRWLDMLKKGAYEKSFNALNMTGEPTPSGQVIKLWNDYVYDALVEVKLPGDYKNLFCYASVNSKDKKQMTVWLANNTESMRPVELNLKEFSGEKVSSVYLYSGAGADDQRPEIKKFPRVPVLQDGALSCKLPAYSIVVLQFGG